MPLNSNAVQIANEKLWAAHPELNRRQLTSNASDRELRREWMSYYEDAANVPSPPEPQVTPEDTSKPDLDSSPPSAVIECDKECKDESGRVCPCKELSTVSFYVQKGDSPTVIVGGYAYDKVTGTEPSPNTGHAFLGIGDGELQNQEVFGFYPVTSWLGEKGGINTNDGFIVPGDSTPRTDIYDPENEHIYSHKLDFKACPETIAKLKDLIKKDISLIKSNAPNAPVYNLADLQCTTWARGLLKQVGFNDPGGFSPHGAAENIDDATQKQNSSEDGSKQLF